MHFAVAVGSFSSFEICSVPSVVFHCSTLCS